MWRRAGMIDPTYQGRRRFLGSAAAAALVAGQVAIRAETRKPAGGPPRSFASLRQVEAGLLNVGYAEAGPSDGRAVILLHGWPYDIHSYLDASHLLAAEGFR